MQNQPCAGCLEVGLGEVRWGPGGQLEEGMPKGGAPRRGEVASEAVP